MLMGSSVTSHEFFTMGLAAIGIVFFWCATVLSSTAAWTTLNNSRRWLVGGGVLLSTILSGMGLWMIHSGMVV